MTVIILNMTVIILTTCAVLILTVFFAAPMATANLHFNLDNQSTAAAAVAAF
jgi:antibiotic biosynthesis monooxygenase (ABM) superfamily enzyme